MRQVSMHAYVLVSVHAQVNVANSESIAIYEYTNLRSAQASYFHSLTHFSSHFPCNVRDLPLREQKLAS